MSEILNWIMDSIRANGALSVFIGVIIESVIVPIPSPLIIMGAGFLLIGADLRFLEALMPIVALIVAPGAVASTLGAYIGYAIGYLGGKPLVERWQGFLGFSWRDVEAMGRRFRAGQVNTTIFFLRALPIFPLSVISAAAGLLRLPLRQFSLWTFLGAIPRCLFLGYLGWGLGETYQGLARGLDRVETAVSALLILAIVAGIVWLRARVRGRILKPSVD
ncbi:MAG TPA: VTT domain-containing protein [candidate division Zixibacteria bacterium]|nr:VTT domain-containing protein [candidate division Zixibacteria bacterium]